MKQGNRSRLKPYIPMPSHKVCYSCKKERVSTLFTKNGNVCLKCRSARGKERREMVKMKYKEAASGCWWLKCYFTITEKELCCINKHYK